MWRFSISMRLYFLLATVEHEIEKFKVTVHDALLFFLVIIDVEQVGFDHIHLYR